MILLIALLLAQADNRVKLCDKADAKKCATVNASGQVSISGTISASTTGRATAVAPSYVEGTDNPLSIDLTGNIRTLATATTVATATAANPSYTEGSTSAISQDLSGHLRNACTQAGTWTVQPGNTANTTAWKVDGSAVTQPVSGTFWQATQPVSGTFWQATQPVSGTVTANQGGAPWSVAGNVASGASDSGNPVKSGGVFNTTQPTVTNGQRVDSQATARGAQIVATGADAFTVAGTVTTTPPSNASTNVTQWNGTTVDTNSGSKTAGTLRVVLATDQPALTNKLLVTPDSVALPANQSVNVAQLAGTTTDTNSGSKSAGTLRVVLATDQPALTNKLLVTPDSVALPANQSVNVAQFGGTNTVTGTGAGGSGIPRVTISNDSSLAANQSVNLAQVGGTNTLTGGTAGSLGVGGLAAEGAAISGNPVYTAGRGFNAIAFAPRYCDKIAAITTLGTTATVQQIALVASQKIYICGYLILASTLTTGVQLKWVEGTGTNCATGQANVTPAIFTTPNSAPTTANFTLGPFGSPGIPWMATAGDALCINQSSATNATTLSGVIFYTQN